MPVRTDLIVKGGFGGGFEAAALFGITRADPRELLSPHHTRVFGNSFLLRLGMRLVTNRRRPILVLGAGHRRQPRSAASRRGPRLPRTTRTPGPRGDGGERPSGLRQGRGGAGEAARSGQLVPRCRSRIGWIAGPRAIAVAGRKPCDVPRGHRRDLRGRDDRQGHRTLGRGSVDAPRGARPQLAGMSRGADRPPRREAGWTPAPSARLRATDRGRSARDRSVRNCWSGPGPGGTPTPPRSRP